MFLVSCDTKKSSVKAFEDVPRSAQLNIDQSHKNSREDVAFQVAEAALKIGKSATGFHGLCDLSKPLRNMALRNRPKTNPSNASARSTKNGTNTNVTNASRGLKSRIRAPVPPMQIFDNFYFVGTGGVASWVLKTSEGLILIDALSNNRQAKQYIEAGLLQLGLNPKDIKYIIVTHGHGDHYGGQEYLVKHYAPRIILSEADWDLLKRPVFSSPNWGVPPKKDMVVHDGQSLKLGDTSVDFYVTPGHTWGTLSLVFTVYDRGQAHKVAFWGGTGLNFGPDAERIMAYSKSASRMQGIVKKEMGSILLTGHPKRDGALQKMRQLELRASTDPHPFVDGVEETLNTFTMISECARAQVLKIQIAE